MAEQKSSFLSTPCGSVASSKAPYHVKGTDSVKATLALMDKKRIVSVPVVNPDNSNVTGLVKLRGIVAAAFKSLSAESTAEDVQTAISDFLAQPISFVEADPLKPSFNHFTSKEPLSAVLQAFANGDHQALIHAGDDAQDLNIANFRFLSQSDILGLVMKEQRKSQTLASITNKSLQELHLAAPSDIVVSASASQAAWEVFLRIAEKGVGAVPVLDKQGALQHTLSASDFRTLHAVDLAVLLKPVAEFLKGIGSTQETQVHCEPTQSLRQALALIVVAEVHRCWIVDKDTKGPIGVLSLTDIIGELC